MGCQDLLESVPGRSKAASVALPGWSPSETRSSFISRANRNRGASARNLTKSEDLSSTPRTPSTVSPSIDVSLSTLNPF
jgi:protein kinase N